ncbi:tetratricopeptide repeat protein [Stratiformator vulcanicus]
MTAGNLFARKGKFEKAVRAYETALSIRPDFPAAQRNLIIVRDAWSDK